MPSVFLGIDVGTGSARAGLFDADGNLLAAASRDIAIWRESGAIVEQSSGDIWDAICWSVRATLTEAGVAPADVGGIGVDATCSLVVIAADGRPLPVGPSGDPRRNIIVWMDQRAAPQARRINATRHPVLDYVGGRISPEMQTPKLLWLKENLPETYSAAGHFFDLADYIVWRLTGALTRSLCTLTCKWTYLAHEERWDPSYFQTVGLEDLADGKFARIGTAVAAPGRRVGALTQEAAAALGLVAGTAVAASLIDAHAGGIGTVGADGPEPLEARLAYIFGTSACAMATTGEATFVEGVWGPYFSAMVPDLWLNEAGQSAAGAAIEQLIALHPAAAQARERAEADGLPLLPWLEEQALGAAADPSAAARRARSLQILPEFIGNRSPFADPDARAVIAGLGADRDIASLVDLYVAGVCAIGYGLTQILDALEQRGVAISLIVVSGGAARSPLVRQLLADTTRRAVAVPESAEPVLLGSAILGAVAGGRFATLAEAMRAMSQLATRHQPVGGDLADLHRTKAECYALLQDCERRMRALIEGGGVAPPE